MIPCSVEKYLGTRCFPGPWEIAGTARADFSAVVVIPALAEGGHLFLTLESLARNPPEALRHTLVLVVVNHREDAAPEEKADNHAVLHRLAAGEGVPPGLHLAWVDAASPGRELSAKDGGVGLARKIGFDLALASLDWGLNPVLAALDADTLVRPDYLPALQGHFRGAREGGAVIPFRHQQGAGAAGETAIGRYELFLRHYVLGLSLAGSPYAFHTVGSTMACRAEAYVRAGGMNRRPAGEDFYFLQQLAKTSGVGAVRGTVVFPSARPSGRVLFGTGPVVARLLAGERDAVRFYPPESFRLLGDWLRLAALGWEEAGEVLQGRAEEISPALAEFLSAAGFAAAWDRLARNHRHREQRLRAFHGWFDGLRTLRLIHHLCAGPFSRVGSEETLPQLLAWAGLSPAPGPDEQLALLRAHQGAYEGGAENVFPVMPFASLSLSKKDEPSNDK